MEESVRAELLRKPARPIPVRQAADATDQEGDREAEGGQSEDELEDLLANGLPRFDPDHYQLLTKYLLGPAAPQVREFGSRELREAA